MSCGDEYCGPHRITPNRMRQWAFSLNTLAARIASALGLPEGIVTDVPDRIICLGSRRYQSRRQDVFLVKEAHREDFIGMMRTGTRLAASARGVMLCMARLPSRTDTPSQLGTISLAETIEWRESSIWLPADLLNFDVGCGSLDAGVVLTDVDLNVLQALAASEEQVQIADLRGASGYGRRAVETAIKRLAAAGYLNRPAGTARKGVGLTAQGRRFFSESQKRPGGDSRA